MSGGGADAGAFLAVSISAGVANVQLAYTERRPTPFIASHMAMPCVQKSARSLPGGVWYAEHTSMSSLPSASATSAKARSSASSELTSQGIATPRPPAAVIASAVASTLRSEPSGTGLWPPEAMRSTSAAGISRELRPSAYTAYPDRPSSMAIPLPMPRDAPVTTATRCGSTAVVTSRPAIETRKGILRAGSRCARSRRCLGGKLLARARGR
eukprot:scaffold43088_cov64-Phaeocystis_antarctica.AAC.5